MATGILNSIQIGCSFPIAHIFGVFEQYFTIANDGVERRAQFVAHIGQESALGAICNFCNTPRRFGGFLGFGHFALGAPTHFDFFFQADIKKGNRILTPPSQTGKKPKKKGGRINYPVQRLSPLHIEQTLEGIAHSLDIGIYQRGEHGKTAAKERTEERVVQRVIERSKVSTFRHCIF